MSRFKGAMLVTKRKSNGSMGGTLLTPVSIRTGAIRITACSWSTTTTPSPPKEDLTPIRTVIWRSSHGCWTAHWYTRTPKATVALIYPGLAQRMTAGTGIWHSERNDQIGISEPVELVQMWLIPDETEVTPGYEQLEISPSELDGKLAVLASGMPQHRNDAAIRLQNRYAALHVTRLAAGQSVVVPDAPFVHVYVPRGRVELEGAGSLETGDAARLTAAGELSLTAREPSEILIWEMRAAMTKDFRVA